MIDKKSLVKIEERWKNITDQDIGEAQNVILELAGIIRRYSSMREMNASTISTLEAVNTVNESIHEAEITKEKDHYKKLADAVLLVDHRKVKEWWTPKLNPAVLEVFETTIPQWKRDYDEKAREEVKMVDEKTITVDDIIKSVENNQHCLLAAPAPSLIEKLVEEILAYRKLCAVGDRIINKLNSGVTVSENEYDAWDLTDLKKEE